MYITKCDLGGSMEYSYKINAKRLKELRKKRFLTQGQLAKQIQVTHYAVSTWELGTRNPGLKHLEKLCEYFDVPLKYLVEEK